MLFPYRLIASDISSSAAESQRRRLLTAFACFTLILFGVTYRLWLQQSAYPQIPLFAWARLVPHWLDLLSLAAMFVGVLIMSLVGDNAMRQRVGLAMFLCASGLLIATDQHRLQPWLWQLMILSVFLSLFNAKDSIVLSRLLLVSIYLFSAWSKFDYEFLHSIGLQFSHELFGWVGLNTDSWSESARLWTAALFPLGELCVGVGLFIPKTRRLVAWLAVGLHLVLLLILGPWGLNHHWGVLAWNAFFVAQIWILFLMPIGDQVEEREVTTILSPWKYRVACLVILLPILEPFGFLDHWPAWQLYAPRNSRVTMSVLENSLDKLPEELRLYVTASPDGLWHRVDLERWSLESIGVPIYPQARFQLGVALALAKKNQLGGGIQVDLLEVSSRWDGRRKSKTLRSEHELTEAAESFRLNAVARAD